MSQPSCLYFRGVPKIHDEKTVNLLIRHQLQERLTPNYPKPEDRKTLQGLFETIQRVQLHRNPSSRYHSGFIYFSSQEAAGSLLRLLRYIQIDENDPKSELHLMWRDDNKERRQTGEGNIFVRNLHESITTRKLCSAFEPIGRVVSARVSRDQNGKSNGFGYVQFDNENTAKTAIERTNKKFLLGQEVSVEPYKPATERAKKQASEFTNVYIRNLPADMTVEGLKELCEKEVGEVTNACIKLDPRDATKGGTGRSFGMANFKTHELAKQAIEKLNGYKLEDGQELYCVEHQTKKRRLYMRRQRQLDQQKKFYSENRNVRVTGIASSTTLDALKTYMGQFGEVESARMFPVPRLNNQQALVLLGTRELAQQAISTMDNAMIPELNPETPIGAQMAHRTQHPPRPSTVGYHMSPAHYANPVYSQNPVYPYPGTMGPTPYAYGPTTHAPPPTVAPKHRDETGRRYYENVKQILGTSAQGLEEATVEGLARKITGIMLQQIKPEQLETQESITKVVLTLKDRLLSDPKFSQPTQ